MSRIFLDTDVVIDFLTKREPFSRDILRIFQFGSKKNITLTISSLSISNVYYIVSKIETTQKAIEKIKILLQIIEVLNVDAEVIHQAINSGFKDFEDAIQHYCAKKAQIDLIITRNTKDYKASELAILTPSEFVVKYHFT